MPTPRELPWIPALFAAIPLVPGCAAPAGPPPVEIRAIHIEAMARAMWNGESGEGDSGRAAGLFEEAARRYAGEGGQEAARASCLHDGAWCLQPGMGHGSKEEWAAVRARFEEAARIRETLGDRAGQAVSLFQAAACLRPDHDRKGGDWARAAAGFEEAARLWGEAGRKAYRAKALHRAAWCLQSLDGDSSLGTWGRITEHFAEAAQIRAETRDPAGRAESLRALARALASERNPSRSWEMAGRTFDDAAGAFRAAGDYESEGECRVQARACRERAAGGAGK